MEQYASNDSLPTWVIGLTLFSPILTLIILILIIFLMFKKCNKMY